MERPKVSQAFLKALTLACSGDVDQAHGLLRPVLEANPVNARASEGLRKLLEGSARRNQVDPPPKVLERLARLHAASRHDALVDEIEPLIERHPRSATLLTLLGAARGAQGRWDEAEVALRLAVVLAPNRPGCHVNLGNALRAQGLKEEAEKSFAEAVALEATDAQSLLYQAHALRRMGRAEDMAAHLERADAIEPIPADQRVLLADSLRLNGRNTEAIAHLRLVRADAPHVQNYSAHYYHQLMHICDWSEYEEMTRAAPTMGVQDQKVDPFSMLPIEDSPHRQLARARLYSVGCFGNAPKEPLVASAPAHARGKVRVGYFAGDAINHATMHLMKGVFRRHDRTAFDVTVFSYSRPSLALYRDHFLADTDRVIDISEMNSGDATAIARSAGLDIAVDLKGYTHNFRLGELAARVAPVQIHHLAYPSSLGATFIDYIVADHVVIPPEWRSCYSENVIYMPNSYQCTDNTRMLSSKNTNREDFGLPKRGVVLCCFNHVYKITPREFDIWMRLLKRLPDSVLWLLKSNDWCATNLRSEAAMRGVSPDRLVFAAPIPQHEHLARIVHADLFLDTFNVNAHTTASDALWAGLPVVTKIGDQFAARVAASLLTAVGLPELITRSEREYEDLIWELASKPERLAELRSRLAINRLVEPLFDTARYTTAFEAGLKAAARRSADGLPPEDIDLAPAPGP